jgi:hypothetical protein
MVIGLLALSFGLGVYTGMAGAPEPPGPPGSTSSYSLEDVYNRLDTGATGTQSTFAEPSSGPGTETMHTLDDIMGIAPAADDTNGAVPGDVLSGKTYWGLRTDGTWGAQTGTATYLPAPVPKTGQTDCYLSADPWGICTCGTTNCPSGQDGGLEKGVAWPNPRFTDNGDGTVTDNLTGLIWLQNANCPGPPRAWGIAHDDVVQLNTNGKMNDNDCGDTSNGGSHQTDWRLPSVRELFSLIDSSQCAPTLPSAYTTYFTDVQSSGYWSSTTFACLASGAWYVSLGDGYVNSDDKTGAGYVWPVRGGQ